MRVEASVREILLPRWPEVLLLASALIVALIGYSGQTGLTDIANLLAPTLLTIAMAFGCVGMLRASVSAIWTPLFWLRVSLIAYCGIGSLVPFFVNDETSEVIEAFYQFFPADVAKYNLIVCCFVLLVLTTVALLLQGAHARDETAVKPEKLAIQPSALDMRVIGLIFLAVGFVVRYLILLPIELGPNTEVYSSSLGQLAQVYVIGCFLLALWALRARSALFWVVVLLVAIEFVVGVLTFAKIAALFPVIVLSMAMILHRPTKVRFVSLAALVLALYFAITPLVSYGRAIMLESYGLGGGAPLSERSAIIASYTPGAISSTRDSTVQGGWSRLSYVNTGTFAISQYDSGLPGNSFRHLAVVWVPRLLYPEKPIITDVSRDFSVAATGNYNSQANPGLPAEGYWNYGWPGVPLVAVVLAIVLTFWSIYSIRVVRMEAWHLLVVVLLGMRTGLRIDGMLVADIIGPISFAVVAHIALSFLNRVVPSAARGGRLARQGA